MKKYLPYISLVVLFALVIYSCQQEISFEDGPVSQGFLVKDINGNCLPLQVAGIYTATHATNSTNYISVSVHVASAGNYLVSTETLNGYSFKATGRFADTGIQLVKLACTGIPRAAGTDHFIISYNGSTCQATVAVADSASHALFTLEGSPNACMNAVVSGGYIKGNPTDTSCKIKISLAVTTPGVYTISTNTVNGYHFTGSGTLTATGIQTVYLTASGTPVNAGTDVFTVSAATTTCTFPVTVLSAIAAINNDYFPLTPGSHWTYDDVQQTAADSLKRTTLDTVLQNGNLYRVMREDTRFWGALQYFFRKSGSEYFEYTKADKYTNSFQYANPLYTDLPFLKENLTTGTTWSSPEYDNMASFGQELFLQYDYTCNDANASLVINGNAFTNVYKITMRPRIRSVGNAWGYTGETYIYHYAKGIGLISMEKLLFSATQSKLQLREWLVR